MKNGTVLLPASKSLTNAMNNDPTPTPAALPTVPESANTTIHPPVDSAAESHRQQQENAPAPAQSRATLQMKKKYEFIDNIMNNLDMLIYVELCILYYME